MTPTPAVRAVDLIERARGGYLDATMRDVLATFEQLTDTEVRRLVLPLAWLGGLMAEALPQATRLKLYGVLLDAPDTTLNEGDTP